MKIEEIQKSLGDIESKLTDIKKSENENIEKGLENIKDNLQKIHRKEFNIMDIFGITTRELSHSAFLSWLLDPLGPHDLGDKFLRLFLEKAGLPEHISLKNLKNVKVEREVQGDESIADIIVSNESFFCLIENKIESSEGEKQTPRLYRDFHNTATHKFERFVYLTPIGDHPKCKEFKALNYYDIKNILKDILNSLPPKNDKINDKVKYIMDEYVKNLEVNRLSKKFEGFGERAKMYSKYYDNIEKIRKSWNEDVKTFLDRVREEIKSKDWFGIGWEEPFIYGTTELEICKEDWLTKKSEKGEKQGVYIFVKVVPYGKNEEKVELHFGVWCSTEKFRKKLKEKLKNLNKEKLGNFKLDPEEKCLVYRESVVNFGKELNEAVSGINEAVKRFAGLIDECIKSKR